MSQLRRLLISGSAVGALVTTLALPSSVVAAPEGQSRGHASSDSAGTGPGKGDSDGDRIADDLEAVLAGSAASERVDVIIQGATAAQARRAAGSFVGDHTYSIIPAFSGSVTAGQVTALSHIPGVTRIELDGVARAADAAGD